MIQPVPGQRRKEGWTSDPSQGSQIERKKRRNLRKVDRERETMWVDQKDSL